MVLNFMQKINNFLFECYYGQSRKRNQQRIILPVGVASLLLVTEAKIENYLLVDTHQVRTYSSIFVFIHL